MWRAGLEGSRFLRLESGWYLVVLEAGEVFVNECPEVSDGNGICIGVDLTDAVKALEEIHDRLQEPVVMRGNDGSQEKRARA